MDGVLDSVTAEQLFEGFSSVFDTINGRAVKDLHPHELLFLLTPEDSKCVVRFIVDELCFLECTDSNVQSHKELTVSSILDYVRGRGFPLESITESMFNDDVKIRKIVLYLLMMDLLAVRLLTRKKQSNRALVTTKSETEESTLHILVQTVKSLLLNFELASHDETIAENLADLLPTIKNLKDKPYYKDDLVVRDLPSSFHLKAQDLVNRLNEEYSIRHDVLLKRLNVTIRSFFWSNNLKMQETESSLVEAAQKLTQAVPGFCSVTLADLLTVSWVEIDTKAISSDSAKNQGIKAVLIGTVPNRGGIPEGYSRQHVFADVTKANISLQEKDKHDRNKGQASHSQKRSHDVVMRGQSSNFSPHHRGDRHHHSRHDCNMHSNNNEHYNNMDYNQQPQMFDYSSNYNQPQYNNNYYSECPPQQRFRTQYDNSFNSSQPRGYSGNRGSFGGRRQDRPPSNNWPRHSRGGRF